LILPGDIWSSSPLLAEPDLVGIAQNGPGILGNKRNRASMSGVA
jgi:hypothetical protein